MRRIERMAVVKNRTVYRVADAHTHIYPERIAEKATNAIGVFYDFQMENIGLPDTLFALGNKAGIDKYLVSSVATKVEQVRSISVYIAETCRVNPPISASARGIRISGTSRANSTGSSLWGSAGSSCTRFSEVQH
jgi:hypothetical protein